MEHQLPEKAERSNKRNLRTVAIVLITCVCGWFIMELEILGVRVLAPYFGSSVYVVTGSVIGVFLLSLSAGYILGGWLSTKTNSQYALGINLMAAGVWLCSMPFFVEFVCDGMFNIGLDEKWGSLLAALVLFGVPTMLLGTVSPAAVYWLTTQASDSGFKTGLVFAFSTVASFAGCVVTAFYLVLLSMRHTICASGVVLLALGGTILLRAATQGTRDRAAKPGRRRKIKYRKASMVLDKKRYNRSGLCDRGSSLDVWICTVYYPAVMMRFIEF